MVAVASPVAAQTRSESSAPQPRSLAEATARALAGNLELRLARTDTGLARAQLIGSRLRPNPSIAVQYQTTGDRTRGGLESDATISVTQDLQLWGVRSKRIETAMLEQQRATYSALDAERLVRREVAASYRELLFEEQQATLLDSLARINERIARAAQLAFQQGLGSELDTRLSVAAAQQSLLDRDRASRAYDIEQLEFARLQGDTLGTVYRLTDSLPPTGLRFLAVRSPVGASADVIAFALSDEGADSLVRVALTARPDVRAAEYAVRTSVASLALARLGAKPTVSVGGLLSRSRDNFAVAGLQGSNLDQAIGIGVVVGLPLRNKNQGEIARTEVVGSEAAVRLTNVRLLVERDVRVAAQRVALAATQAETLRQSILPGNTAALRIAEAAFARGQASIFQVLQVQRAYVDSTTGLLEARRQYAAALADLESAIGQPVQ